MAHGYDSQYEGGERALSVTEVFLTRVCVLGWLQEL